MKTEIKLNDFPDPPPVKLPRLLYHGVLNSNCTIALQTGFAMGAKESCFNGVVLHSTDPGYIEGELIDGWNMYDWKEFTHILTLSNE